MDLDPQAVEVTKLNLLLKCMEGDIWPGIARQMKLLHDRVLPNIDGNIKCGNSLIGQDYFEGRLVVDPEEEKRVNAFDWDGEKGFPSIMQAGGFDCVAGNPPYIQASMSEHYNPDVARYYRTHYSSSMARLNTFGLFIERGLSVLARPGGRVSFIVPNTLLTQEYYEPLRGLMLGQQITSLTCFTEMVFHGAVVETVVFVVRKGDPRGQVVNVARFDNRAMVVEERPMPQAAFLTTHRKAFVITADDAMFGLGSRLLAAYPPLGALANTNQAIALKHDRARSLHSKAADPTYKRVLDGRDIGRYWLRWPGTYLAYNRDLIHSCKRTDIFECAEKLFIRRVAERLTATLDERQHYALNTLVVVTWGGLGGASGMSLRYLLGLLNSRLLNECYVRLLKSTKRVFSEVQARQLARLPIPPIDFSDPSDVARHDKMVALVERMLDLHKRLPAAKTKSDRELIERRIKATDDEIDALVHELYGLTPEEIAIIEDGS